MWLLTYLLIPLTVSRVVSSTVDDGTKLEFFVVENSPVGTLVGSVATGSFNGPFLLLYTPSEEVEVDFTFNA